MAAANYTCIYDLSRRKQFLLFYYFFFFFFFLRDGVEGLKFQ